MAMSLGHGHQNHILICRLGSAGQLHWRHFRPLGIPRIEVFSTGKGTTRMPPDSLLLGRLFDSLEEALHQGRDFFERRKEILMECMHLQPRDPQILK